MVTERAIWRLLAKLKIRKNSMLKTPAQEIAIPTSYGHITGKVWGPENGREVLALHGWQDNCASFDTLIPLLPNHLRVIAIDFPGHGFSSHKPIGATYNFIDQLTDVKTVSTYFGWKRFSVIGHSLGGATALLYACCFPTEIEALVTLDGLDPDYIPSFKYAPRTAQVINKTIEMNNKLHNPPPLYSYEDAFNRLKEGQKEFMSGKGVRYLMQRAVKPAGGDQNTFVFTRDIRVQSMNFQPTAAIVWTEYLKYLECNLLYIRAKNGIKRRQSDISEFLENHYKTREENYEVAEVEGLHHVHLEHPDRIVPYLTHFFAN